MIIGCFLAFGLLVAISLNPYLLTQKSETKTLVQLTKSISFTQVLIEQLERFSQQVKSAHFLFFLFCIDRSILDQRTIGFTI